MYKDKFNSALENLIITGKLGENENIPDLVACFLGIRSERNTICFIGNGGSAGIAVHMTADFLKNGKMRTHSMFDPATITCLANDYGYEYVFSKQLEIVANPGDLLVAISSSGNSPNIINAAETAKKMGCQVITFTGFKPDNKLRRMGDINVYVPCMEYGIVESIHNMILQQIVDEIMEKIKGMLSK